jgi:putative transposase
VRRSFRFLLRPTARQADALAAMLGDHRALYNAALQERRDAWRMRGISIRYGEQSAQLKDIRRADPDGQGRWSFSSQQATLRRLNRAFEAFFRRVRAGQTPGFPRFKGAGWFDTVEWPTDRDGCRWDSVIGQRRVYLQGVGHVRVHQHRPIAGRVKTISAKREGRRWYVIVSCDEVPANPLPATGRAVGIDVGTTHFLSDSNGGHRDNPRFGRRGAERLAKAQRNLATKKKGSNRRRMARERVAAAHRKIRNQRTDFLHKEALRLVREHDLIACEDLTIRSMTRSASGTVDNPGVGVAAKSGLNFSILDASWGRFLAILTDKAESAGRLVIAVDARNTSRTCAECGHCAAENRAGASFRCVSCGHAAHADVNAAVNILRAGLARQGAQAA